MRWVSEAFPPKSKFDPERDIPDLSGKVVIVTGGNTGIGKETIRILLLKNAKVYMASRSKDRADEAIAELKTVTGKDAHFLQLDLASLDAITKAANEFLSKEKALHILFNNGGVMHPPIDQLTTDGFDLQFGTNVLGHAHFTLCLVEALKEGARTSSDGKARIVNTSSSAATMYDKIDLESIVNGPKRVKVGRVNLYAQSKLGNAVFSNEFAKRYAEFGITSNALNPGNIKTELQRHIHWIFQKILDQVIYPVTYGALTQLWVGTSPETVNSNGGYFIPWARVGEMPKGALDKDVEPRLWDWIEEQRKLHL